jgi:hypothetical protein
LGTGKDCRKAIQVPKTAVSHISQNCLIFVNTSVVMENLTWELLTAFFYGCTLSFYSACVGSTGFHILLALTSKALPEEWP